MVLREEWQLISRELKVKPNVSMAARVSCGHFFSEFSLLRSGQSVRDGGYGFVNHSRFSLRGLHDT
jgi:hypothetical protein